MFEIQVRLVRASCTVLFLRLLTSMTTKALFSCEKILDFDTVALSFLFDKHYPIVE